MDISFNYWHLAGILALAGMELLRRKVFKVGDVGLEGEKNTAGGSWGHSFLFAGFFIFPLLAGVLKVLGLMQGERPEWIAGQEVLSYPLVAFNASEKTESQSGWEASHFLLIGSASGGSSTTNQLYYQYFLATVDGAILEKASALDPTLYITEIEGQPRMEKYYATETNICRYSGWAKKFFRMEDSCETYRKMVNGRRDGYFKAILKLPPGTIQKEMGRIQLK